MPVKLVNIDRDTPLLLPPDLRDWIQEDDMVHFVIDAVQGLVLEHLHYNESGSGSPQYPPRMMLSLLLYCYSQAIFSSRKIETATYRNVSVRFLTADTHPDHDTIAAFRSDNPELLKECFVKVVLLANKLGMVKMGKVSVDGSKFRANASKHRNVTAKRADELIPEIEADLAELVKQAEAADQSNEIDGDKLPESIANRQKLLEKLKVAKAEAERRAKEKHAEKQREYEEKCRKREAKQKGPKPKPPPDEPEIDEDQQINFTDPDSRVMRNGSNKAFEQNYNPQAVVDNENGILIGARVSQSGNDFGELLANVESIPEELGLPDQLLADSGYGSGEEVLALEAQGVDMYVCMGREAEQLRRAYEFRPDPPKGSPEPKAQWRVEMKAKLATEEGRKIYGERFHSGEVVFGIIKHVLGFRQFSMRGIEKVVSEWDLIGGAYNLKKMFKLQNG